MYGGWVFVALLDVIQKDAMRKRLLSPGRQTG